MIQDLSELSLTELLTLGERAIRKARRNVGKAWKEVEQAKLQLARSK